MTTRQRTSYHALQTSGAASKAQHLAAATAEATACCGTAHWPRPVYNGQRYACPDQTDHMAHARTYTGNAAEAQLQHM
eukprot:7795658-Pyramimonas_sp.AAC.1